MRARELARALQQHGVLMLAMKWKDENYSIKFKNSYVVFELSMTSIFALEWSLSND